MAKSCRNIGGKPVCNGPRTDWWKDAMGIDWYSPGPAPEPEPEALGTLHADNFTSGSLDAYTLTGDPVGISTDGNGLQFTGGAGNFSKHIVLSDVSNPHRYTALEKWEQRVVVTTPSSMASAFGFGIGVRSFNGYDFIQSMFRWAWDEASDRIYYYSQDATGSQLISSTGFVASTSTTYVVRLIRNKNVFTYKILNSDETVEHFSTSFTTLIASAPSGKFAHNTGRFVINNFGGTFTINSWTISSTAQKNIKYVAIGDSNMAGAKTDVITNRFVELAFAGESFEILAGAADRTTEVLLRVDEIIALNPRYAFISLLRNDVASGTASGTYQANYDSIISQLEAAGIIVLLSTPIASINNLATVDTWIKTHSQPIADLFAVTRDGPPGTVLKTEYNSGDGIHLNADAQQPCADEIVTIL